MIAVKAQYEEILSIHIYSLSPGPINVTFFGPAQTRAYESLERTHAIRL